MPLYDAVYPLGTGSKIKNLEIFLSLRSLAKYARDLGNVYIVGERPSRLNWGERLQHIPFTEGHKRGVNIWEKAVAVAADPRISERFLWMNDDFYLLQELSAGAVPYFCQGKTLERHARGRAVGGPATPYQQMLRRTLAALHKRGLSTHHFGTHQPINFEKTKIRELYEVFKDDLYTSTGISLRICYGNYFKVDPVMRPTRLIHDDTPPSLDGLVAISSHASASAANLRQHIKSLYPGLSEFELGEHNGNSEKSSSKENGTGKESPGKESGVAQAV